MRREGIFDLKNPTQWKALVPGLSLTIILAVLAWFCGHRVPIVGAPVFGILFGMLVALFVNSPALREGTRLASKRLLQLSVVLLGFEMNMRNVLVVGSESLVVMAFTLTAAFINSSISSSRSIKPPVRDLSAGMTAVFSHSPLIAS